MDIKLQLFFILASVLTFWFIIRQIRKQGLNIQDSIIWILWAMLLLLFSFFPGIPGWISKGLGFMSMSNFILCLFIFFLYIVVFLQMLQISKLKEKQTELIQKLSIMNNEYEKRETKQ